MIAHLKNQEARRAATRGTTLSELMVAMGVLLIMFLVMSTLVSGIRKVFQGGRSQADSLENGRAAMDMIVRDIEQMAAAGTSYENFMVSAYSVRPMGPHSLYQGGEFFCSTFGTNWQAIAYGFYDHSGAFNQLTTNVVGKIYRWRSLALPNNTVALSNLWTAYANAPSTNYSPVVDGVVHFRVQGINLGVPAQPGVRFLSNSLPTHVEVELGVLEGRFADNLRGRPLPEQTAMLTANLNKVYLFRQLVPIKNAHK